MTHHTHMHMLHNSCSKSSARPATNRRNAMRRAEANAKRGGAPGLKEEIHTRHTPSDQHYSGAIVLANPLGLKPSQESSATSRGPWARGYQAWSMATPWKRAKRTPVSVDSSNVLPTAMWGLKLYFMRIVGTLCQLADITKVSA